MNRIAQFEKISKENFVKYNLDGMRSWFETTVGEKTKDYCINYYNEMYDDIKLPKRATSGSAGYDFYAPCDFILEPGDTIKIPTGIRVKIQDGWVLMIFPRSGLGFKYRLQLDNTVGIIDSDYYFSDNEGHIMIKITNCGNKTLEVKKGQGFAQGVFVQYGITEDDDATAIRNGGFGSTTK